MAESASGDPKQTDPPSWTYRSVLLTRLAALEDKEHHVFLNLAS
jgi:hypothetical protein